MKFKLIVILIVAIQGIALAGNLDGSHDIKLDSGDTLRVVPISSNILRVRLSEDGQFTQALMNRYGIINEDWPKVEV
jgi:hypothetical protein